MRLIAQKSIPIAYATDQRKINQFCNIIAKNECKPDKVVKMSISTPLLSYRTTTESDREFAREVHHSSYHDVVVRQFGGWDEKLQDEFFTANWIPGKSQIIFSDNVPVGTLNKEVLEAHIKLVELQILPTFQGKGIGTLVLEDVISDAKCCNKPICLQVLKENKAKYLYARHGFITSGETDLHLLMEWHPA